MLPCLSRREVMGEPPRRLACCPWQAQLDVAGEGVAPWTEELHGAAVQLVAQAQQVEVVQARVRSTSLRAPAPSTIDPTLNIACSIDAVPAVLDRLGQLYADADPAPVLALRCKAALPLGWQPQCGARLLRSGPAPPCQPALGPAVLGR